MQMRPILRGLKTFVTPNPDRKGTGGTVSARYCYSVWLRHLVRAAKAGCDAWPRVVAEVRPLMDSYVFPEHILSEERLATCLRPDRLRSIELALERVGDASTPVPG